MIAEAAEQLETQEVPLQRRSILIVDDDADQADVLAYRLQNQGFETFTATTGRQGLESARTNGPDLVVMDLRLPDIDGMRVCEQLTDDSTTCDIPILVLSGMERPDVIRCARSAGCRYYVRKPYDPNALLVLIETALAEANQW